MTEGHRPKPRSRQVLNPEFSDKKLLLLKILRCGRFCAGRSGNEVGFVSRIKFCIANQFINQTEKTMKKAAEKSAAFLPQQERAL